MKQIGTKRFNSNDIMSLHRDMTAVKTPNETFSEHYDPYLGIRYRSVLYSLPRAHKEKKLVTHYPVCNTTSFIYAKGFLSASREVHTGLLKSEMSD